MFYIYLIVFIDLREIFLSVLPDVVCGTVCVVLCVVRSGEVGQFGSVQFPDVLGRVRSTPSWPCAKWLNEDVRSD